MLRKFITNNSLQLPHSPVEFDSDNHCYCAAIHEMDRLGAEHSGSNISIINSTSSRIHFTQYHAAVLVLTDIAYLVVEDVTIVNYTGFGLITVNLPDASFNRLEISYSQNYVLAAFRGVSIGSGMLVLFCNHTKSSNLSFSSKYNLRVNNSTFAYNFAFNQYYSNTRIVCVSEIRHDSFSSMPVINAAGFTILYTQTDLPATVTIANSSLSNNVGSLAAALLLVRFTSRHDSQTVINNSQFTSNSMIMGNCHGAAIAVNGSTSKPGSFFHNYGTVFTMIDSKIILEGTLFFNSNIADHGTALALLGDLVDAAETFQKGTEELKQKKDFSNDKATNAANWTIFACYVIYSQTSDGCG
uniref:Right handed beta helix domain-containing protein n=1 Tax=Amphimedon queenslandica TaxID=400682 RepID=A0A1X7UEL5_AMPQE